MIFLFYILFIFGCISYFISLLFFATENGEIFSDIGNGIMLVNAVLMLLRLTTKNERIKSTGKQMTT
jgi:hypothetical protein